MLYYTYDYTFESVLKVRIMSRSRPAPNLLSYHKHTGQYYVMKGGRRIYMGADRNEAVQRYHRLGLGLEPVKQEAATVARLTVKDLANRFLTARQAIPPHVRWVIRQTPNLRDAALSATTSFHIAFFLQ
jgi:hypothetical protein